MTKPQVREKARALGLSVAEKKDSVGICFVGEVEMKEFLRQRIPDHPGPIVTTADKIVGQHMGLHLYTEGQREGLEIGGGTPYYVIEKRMETNELVVGSQYHPSLYHAKLSAVHCNWFVNAAELLHLKARIRYRQPMQDCSISIPPLPEGARPDDPVGRGLGGPPERPNVFGRAGVGDTVSVVFKNAQRAVTPGQSIVFYCDDAVVGGGIIDAAQS